MTRKLFKNASKILASVFAVALVFSLILGSAEAAPNSITIKEADFTRDFINGGDAGMSMFTTTDGVVVYCMDIDLKPLAEGQSASLNGEADAGVYYILKHGYPKMTYRNNKGKDAYITQMALWWYLSENRLSSKFKNATAEEDPDGLVNATKNLVTAARSATDTPVQPKITINAASTTMSLTNDGKYYESALMSATLTGASTYNVELSGATSGTVVVDEGGNVGTTMNSGEKFKVRVPSTEVKGKMSINVKFSATGKTEKARIYKPSNSEYQRVVGLFEDNVPLNGSKSLSLEPKNSCKIIDGKYYGKDGKEVDKKTYILECKHVCEFTDNKYYGKDGEEVDKKTFNKECNKSCEYIDGKYYGKDGSVVSKKEYEKQCKRVCEIVNGKYYDNNGKEVSQDEFNKACGQEVIVPNTGADIIFFSVGLGILAIAAGIGIIIYRGNKNPLDNA